MVCRCGGVTGGARRGSLCRGRTESVLGKNLRVLWARAGSRAWCVYITCDTREGLDGDLDGDGAAWRRAAEARCLRHEYVRCMGSVAGWRGGQPAQSACRKKIYKDAIADGAQDGDQPTSDAPIYGRGSPHPISIRMMLMGVWCMGWHGRMVDGECGWVVAASRSVEGG